MPEVREGEASGLLAEDTFDDIQDKSDFQVEVLLADASEGEAARVDAHPLAKDGHVYPLAADSCVVRGSNGHQTSLYPPMWKESSDPEAPAPPAIQSLRLQAIDHTNRGLILDLGPLSLMVSLIIIKSDVTL